MRSELPLFYHRTKGSALMVILIIIGLAAALLVSTLRSNPQIERDKITADVMAKAKDALIGYAVSPTGGGQRPGDLLRPDNFATTESPPNYDGKADAGCLDATKANGLPLTSAVGSQNLRCLGRLPWVDMNISIPSANENDPVGIMPWYAVSANLVDPACLAILNSDIITLPQPTLNADATRSYSAASCAVFPNLPSLLPHPWLTVRDEKGNVISSRVAAIIIIPGPPLTGQNRPTSPNLAGPSAYLDNITVAGITYSNADLDNDFIQAPSSDTFNDKLLFITIDELMSAVEKRVAAEAGNALKTFYNTCGFYPKPVDFLNASCYTGTCTSDTSQSQGRFPYSPKPAGAMSYPDWTLPAWFGENRWDAVIYYALSNGFKSLGDGTTLLAVDGSPSASALFFTPAANAPLINRVVTPTILANYLLTLENSDLNTAFTFNNTKEKGYQRKNDPSGSTPSAPNSICGCPAGQSISWTVGIANCSATTSTGFDTNTLALSSTAPGTGSASVICNVGVWQLSATPAPICTAGSSWPFEYPTQWPGVPPLDANNVAVGGGTNTNGTNGNDKVSITGNLTNRIDLKNGDDELLVTGNFNGGEFGQGNDVIKIGGNTTDTIDLGSGNDYLDIGGNSQGDIDAGQGSDKILIGGNATGSIDLGQSDDELYIKGSASGSIDSGSGDNKIRIDGSMSSSIKLGSGDDYVLIFGNAMTIDADSGNDTVLIGGNATGWLDLGADKDYLEILGSSVGLDAGNGNDIVKITGSASNNINLGAGDDILVIGGTITWISGGGGNDKVYLKNYTMANCAALLTSKIANDVENIKVSDGLCRGSNFTVP